MQDQAYDSYVAQTFGSYVFVASRRDKGKGAAPVPLSLP